MKNCYDMLFSVEIPFPNEYPDIQIHRIRLPFANGWMFDKLGATNTSNHDRLRFILCNEYNHYLIENFYTKMIKGE